MLDRQHSARDQHSPGQPDEPVFTAAAMREVDRLAVERFGIPSIVLMENAARSIAAVVEATFRPGLVVVCCGPGNNGGDGYALARHLHNAGWNVSIAATADVGDLKSDALANAQIARRMGLSWRLAKSPLQGELRLHLARADLIVDALFGTGLSRPPHGAAAALIDAINAAHDQPTAQPVVLSVDLPSGLNADTGLPVDPNGGRCVRADLTVTLGGLKAGLVERHALAYTGTVLVGEIGVPRELLVECASGRMSPPGSG